MGRGISSSEIKIGQKLTGLIGGKKFSWWVRGQDLDVDAFARSLGMVDSKAYPIYRE